MNRDALCYESTVSLARRIRAGEVLLGKLHMTEFAFIAHPERGSRPPLE
jgi:hypothetical protein